jgi:hypothetical protein
MYVAVQQIRAKLEHRGAYAVAIPLTCCGGAFLMPSPSPRRSRAGLLRRVLRAVVLAGLVHAVPAVACPSAGLDVVAATPTETRLICRAWADARTALAPLGIAAVPPLRVELAPLEGGTDTLATAFGSYDARRDVVRLRPLAVYLAGVDGGFAQPPSAELWASYAVHEFTHALIDPYVAQAQSRRVTHEFVAYAVQLASMEPTLRTRILADYDARRFTNEQSVNVVTYGFAPHRFAVRAFLTVRAAADPEGYLRTRLRRGFPGLGDTPAGG